MPPNELGRRARDRGLSASVIGMVLDSFAVAATASRIALPIFAAGMREWVLITSALVVGAAVFFVYPFADTELTGHRAVGLGTPIGASLRRIAQAPH